MVGQEAALLSGAYNAALEWLTPERVDASLRCFPERARPAQASTSRQYVERLMLDHLTGTVLGDRIRQSQTVDELLVVMGALHRWLPLCENGTTTNRSWAVTRDKNLQVPTANLRRTLFEKIIASGWMETPVNAPRIADRLAALLAPAMPTPASAQAAFTERLERTTRAAFESLQKYPERTTATVLLLAELTDRGALHESIWADGITHFAGRTPFAVSEEIWRRAVLEKRPVYRPRDVFARTTTMETYMHTYLQRICGQQERNAKFIPWVQARILPEDGQGICLEDAVDCANAITIRVNQAGGWPHPDRAGVRETLPLLRGQAAAVAGEAMRRILHGTRGDANRTQQAYEDSVHADILTMMGAAIPPKGARRHD